MMERDQRILDKMRDFLLDGRRIDNVLFRFWRGIVGRGRIVEDESP